MKNPVLFLTYRRFDTAEVVFNAIRKAQPPKLYFASNAPNLVNSDEIAKVTKVRSLIDRVDWPCEVKIRFLEEHLSVKKSVSSSLDWFFEHEEQGIILEDDCVPSQSFFRFCELMLQKYVNDKNIWMVTGFNPRYPSKTSTRGFLSQNPSVWGWASWQDRWSQYDISMLSWKPSYQLEFKKQVPSYVESYYIKAFENTKNGKIDTWDYQLTFQILHNHGFVIKPYCNLISNIGVDGTHSNKQDKNHYVELGSYIGNAECNCEFDYEEDLWFYRTRLKPSIWSIPLGIIRKIKKLIY
jgi:hypothetical protein